MLVLSLLVQANAADWTACNKKHGMAWSQDLARFESAAALEAVAAQEARLLMTPAPAPIKQPNGVVHILMRRLSLEAANLQHLSFVWVGGDGHRITQIDGVPDIGEIPPAPGPLSGSDAYWWNTATLTVPNADPGLTLHVVDRLLTDKCVFRISGKGKTGMDLVEWTK